MGIEAIVAFGGNTGGVLSGFLSARARLAGTRGLRVLDSSRVYRSSPMGSPEQPDYLNAVVLLDVDMEATTLLRYMHDIEKQHGRIRTGEHWGSRTLDLDLIAYNDTVMHTTSLTLPHPHMHERIFVLQPLCDIRPDWRHPLLAQTVRELLASLLETGAPGIRCDVFPSDFQHSFNDCYPHCVTQTSSI